MEGKEVGEEAVGGRTERRRIGMGPGSRRGGRGEVEEGGYRRRWGRT